MQDERRRILRAMLLVGIGVAVLSGCCNVQPWERAPLSDYTMRRDRDPLRDKFVEHIYFSREAHAGGRDIGGGGCGCN
jgi:hypothetical protein